MIGNSIGEFIDDLLSMGGPEKEFVFRKQRYFMETTWRPEIQKNELYCVNLSDEAHPVYSWFGNSFEECVKQFEKAAIFEGLNIYQAEQEIEVLFG